MKIKREKVELFLQFLRRISAEFSYYWHIIHFEHISHHAEEFVSFLFTGVDGMNVLYIGIRKIRLLAAAAAHTHKDDAV